MKIALIASFEVKDEETSNFENIVARLSEKVLENEDGVHMYQLVRSQNDTNKYRLIEIYENAAVLAAHGQTAHFKELGPLLGACLATKPVIEKFDFIAA